MHNAEETLQISQQVATKYRKFIFKQFLIHP